MEMTIYKNINTVILAFTLIVLSGCATVIKGTSQTVTFTSSPSKAEIFLDGMSQGKTPLTLSLKKNKYSSIMVKKAGYDTINRPIEKNFDPVAIINVFWDLSTTDLITGAIYEYEPNSYNFNLERAGESNDDDEKEVEAPVVKKKKKST